MTSEQKQVQPLQAERQQNTTSMTQQQSQQAMQSQMDKEDGSAIKVSMATELKAKVSLLEETEYYLATLEKLSCQLNDNIMQLRQEKVIIL